MNLTVVAEDLREGDRTANFEVTGRPQRQPTGEIRVPVWDHANPWVEGYVTLDAGESVAIQRDAA